MPDLSEDRKECWPFMHSWSEWDPSDQEVREDIGRDLADPVIPDNRYMYLRYQSRRCSKCGKVESTGC